MGAVTNVDVLELMSTSAFRERLNANPETALAELNLTPEELAGVPDQISIPEASEIEKGLELLRNESDPASRAGIILFAI